MEEQHLIPRRSASHGTLHSSYAGHGRPLHKPLRSVNENSVLLQSPGALESMLKTTTETGDIGIFSIKPFSTSSNLGIPSRGMPPIAYHKTPPRRVTDATFRHDDRRRMPLYRDTTSEILSMYESNSHGSGSTSTSSPTDEMGPRSYSMTTCGSRHLSHNKSYGTLQSHASSGPLQRPRSPFPYPTRLKRPGTRPVSPAITDAGQVDYSRMVEIDRVPIRTNQGSLHPPPPRRPPPPLGMRPDADISNPSLHVQNTPVPRMPPPGIPAVRASSAASMASWNPTYYRERLPSASSRASSLTSVINMYHRIPPSLRGQVGPVAPPPRYYDYTEQFESRQARSITPLQPVSPIPTRASTGQRPLILRDESEEQLAAALGLDPESALFDDDDDSQVHDLQGGMERGRGNRARRASGPSALGRGSTLPQTRSADVHIVLNRPDTVRRRPTRGSDIDLLPSQAGRDSIDTFNPNLDIESPRNVPAYSYPTYRPIPASKTNTASPGRHVQVHCCETSTIHSEQGIILKEDESQPKEPKEFPRKNSHAHPDTIVETAVQAQNCSKQQPHCEPAEDQSKTAIDPTSPTSSGSRAPNTCSKTDSLQLDVDNKSDSTPKLSSEKSTYQAPELLKKSVSQRSSVSSGHGNPLPLSPSSIRDEQNISKAKGKDRSDGDLPKVVVPEHSRYRCHRRNHAVLDIDTNDLPPDDDTDIFPQLRPSCSTTPLISPKPISPARQLKVKNSIPKLMKALPPVPKDGDRSLPTTPSTVSHDEDFGEVLEPFVISPTGTPKAQKSPGIILPGFSVLQHASNRLPSLPQKLPKVRQKSKGITTESTSPKNIRTWDSGNHFPWPLKLPDIDPESSDRDENGYTTVKHNLGPRAISPLSSTVRRRPDIKHSGFVQAPASSRKKELSGFCGPLSSGLDTYDRRKASSGISKESLEESAYLNKAKSGVQAKSKNTNNTCSSKSATLKNSRGLKKSISSLRSLLARSSNAHARSPRLERRTTNSRLGRKLDLERGFESGNISFDHKYLTISEGIAPENLSRPRFRRRLRDKISKWVRGTKSAMMMRGKRRFSA